MPEPHPHSSSPAPGPSAGTMGPPPKPEKEEKEKITDISDISDVIFGSGVDLREEENYMVNTYRNVHGNTSFNTSFNSGTTVASPNNSFNSLTQGSYGEHPAFSGHGPVSQPAQSQESIEEEVTRKHEAAARKKAEAQQQHMRDPFLQGNTIRHRMHRIAYDQGVRINVEGLFDKIPEKPPQTMTATNPDGTAGIAAVKSHGLLNENAPLAEVLALISLAANERMRSFLDEAYTLARARRYGEPKPANPALPETFNRLQITDAQREEERIRKRAQRAAAASNTPLDAAPPSATAESASGGTPAPGATPDPNIAPEKPLSKKERERQAKMGQTEEVLHKNANTTAAMALGMGRKKKYSWLTGGAPSTPSNPYKATPKASQASTPAPSSGKKGDGAKDGPTGIGGEGKVIERKWGGWKEDGIEGRGIQMRDLTYVLERDGREKRALQKCLLKLN